MSEYIAKYYGNAVARGDNEVELLREMTDEYGYDTVMSSDFEIKREENGKEIQSRTTV